MTRTPPTNLRSLEARLRNLARAAELAEGRVRRALSVAIVGQLLRHSRAGVIKGASNLELRLGTEFSRASSDLDAVRFVELDDFRSRLEEALVTGWQGFTGRMIDRGEVGAPVPTAYWPHRFHAKLDFQGRPFSTVELEVASEEVGGLTVHELIDLDPVTTAWFDVLGFEVPGPIPVLPLAHQIAQKLHACTTPDDIGWTNERAHDLIDLQLAVELFAGELAEIRDVAVRLFPARQRQPWPPTVTVREGWANRYREEADGLDVVGDVASAASWVNELIKHIDQA